MSVSNMDTPSHAEIAARAEQIYRESGCTPGRDLENWALAENELKQRFEKNGALTSQKATTKSKTNGRGQKERQRA